MSTTEHIITLTTLTAEARELGVLLHEGEDSITLRFHGDDDSAGDVVISDEEGELFMHEAGEIVFWVGQLRQYANERARTNNWTCP